MVALNGNQRQAQIITETVASAQRSNTLSTLRYKEGFFDYQRVLDSQRSLFRQQQNLVNTHGASVRSLIALYKALGGGWEDQAGLPLIRAQSREKMDECINWGDYLQAPNLDQNRQTIIRRRGFGTRARQCDLRTRFLHHRSVPICFPMGPVSIHQVSRQTSYSARSTGQYSNVYSHFRWKGARCEYPDA